MAWRKRRYPFRRWRRRTRFPRRSFRRTRMMRRGIRRRRARPETKKITTQLENATGSPIGINGNSYLLSVPIAQGTGLNQRVGVQVFVSKIVVKFDLCNAYTNAIGITNTWDDWNSIEMSMWRIQSSAIASVNPPTVWAALGNPTINGFMDVKDYTTAPCRVLRRKVIIMGPKSAYWDNGVAPEPVSIPTARKFKFVIRVNRTLKMDQGGTNLPMWNYFLWVRSDSSAFPFPYIMDAQTRLYFKDP